MKRYGIWLLAGLALILAGGYLGFSGGLPPDVRARLSDLTGGSALAAETDEEPAVAPSTVPVDRGTVEETVIAPGQLEGVKETVLPARVGGALQELSVRPGDRVSAGQVIAQLDKQPFEEALSLAEIKLAQAQEQAAESIADAELALATAETGVTAAQAAFPDLTAAEVRLEQARQAEADALYEYQKAQDRDWEPPDVVESYRRGYEAAVDSRVIAEADYNAVLNQRWANSQSVTAAEIGVDQAQLELERLREEAVDPLLQWEVDKAKRNLTATTLVAPFDGIVLEVAVRPGESVETGQTILVLADVSRGELLTTVIEEDLPLVKPGQVAELYFDAAPDGIVSGTVGRIVPQRTEGDRPLYPVYVEVVDLPVSLLPGMTADAVIVIERRQDVLRLPRAVVRAGEGDTATVQVWNGREAEPREVRLGLRGDTYVEILSGLEEGEMVVGQ